MLVCIGSISAQEICTNGIDDDNDGLIDLNDTEDCSCTSVSSITSLIPNPSFELYDCLPQTFGELSCADTWEQATPATSDFFLNTPGALWDGVIPLPVPDGQGVGGFIISAYPMDITISDFTIYNEYIGGCLLAPMEAGVEYTIQMNVAGSSWDGTTSEGVYYGPINITIFGSTACPEWPVALDPFGFELGCPDILNEWTELGYTSYSADATWQTVTIQFTPTTDIQAIMIGGPCELPADFNVDFINHQAYPYFWIDNLILNESSLFSSIETTGGYCTEDLTLLGTSDTLAEYFQWYYDGVALPDQTNDQLEWSDLNLSEGLYQFIAFQNDSICAGSQIEVSLPAPILPEIQASPLSGCEPLTVQFNNVTPTPSIGCQWDFGDGNTASECNPTHVFSEDGLYSINISVTFENGCTYDSTYQQYIEVFPLPQAVFTASPQPTTINNTQISFFPESNDAITQWQWNFGEVFPNTDIVESPTVIFPSIPGIYPVELIVINSAGCVDTITSYIVIDSDDTVTLPNVFTPNGDGDNDRFIPFEEFPGKWQLTVFNRWGTEIFTTSNLTKGWNGEESPAGTYYWIVEPRDGQQGESQSGYVTMIRE
ncbi:MAG: gliding motility-associated C-terminal domain-containing protein [Flavobacteriales bacterium]